MEIEIKLTEDEIVKAVEMYCRENANISSSFTMTDSSIYIGFFRFSSEPTKEENATDNAE